MMRGARICPLGLAALGQRRHQSEVPAATPEADAETVSKLTSHIRANEDTSASSSGAEKQEGSRMDRARGRMGNNNNNRNFNNNSTEAPKAEDPNYVMQRIHRDAVRSADPLGGQFHKDYFRDPAKGYAPQHAPRNFADGGKVDYPASRTTLKAELSMTARADGDHFSIKYQQQMSQVREATREMTKEEYVQYATEEGRKLQQGAPSRQRVGSRAAEAFNGVMTGHTKGTYVPDLYDLGNKQRKTTADGARAGININDAVKQADLQKKERGFEIELEQFRILHGLREQERHEANLSRRTARKPAVNFDVDRSLAVRGGKMYGQAQFDPLLPTSGMSEAQAALRKNALPDDAQLYAKALNRNTVQDQPLTGEQLTQSMLGLKRLSVAEAEAQFEAARKDALGMGRQGPLTQESGPDRRKQRLHKNDERLLNAYKFVGNAYHNQLSSSRTGTANSADAAERNNTAAGLAHLLNSKFDLDRRQSLLAAGKADPTEAATMHYGIPIPEQVDTFVRTHRNAKGERHLDYFKPFPTRADMALNTAFRDTEGFQMLKNRPDFLEWELFARYRAHHQQRRRLALLHGLEPVPNETIAERDARRERLDKLCEATPFDASAMSKPKAGELPVSVDGLRKHFGAYFIPSPTIARQIVEDASSSLSIIERAAVNGQNDPLNGVADAREHLMSSRYFNKLAQKDGYMLRIRGPNAEIRNHMVEPQIDYLPEAVTSTFSAKEYALYQKYITQQLEAHEQKWSAARLKRRWIAERNAWSKSATVGEAVKVIDAVDATTGVTTILRLDVVNRAATPGAANANTVTIDGIPYKYDLATARDAAIVNIVFDDNSTMMMEESEYHTRPLAVEEADPNATLNYGLPAYHYNRVNYVETQDAIWEEGAYKGDEGWTVAMELDGLREGLPVLARRPIKRADGSILAAGEAQRAEIVQFQHQPFFNPNPRHITVRYLVDGSVESVPLNGVYIWQLSRNGPERTVHDESRKTAQTIKRYVDVADPMGEKQQAPHFLDRYRTASSEDPFRSVKQITDLDNWNINDESRADNTRPLTIADRKNYIKYHYVPYFTPWDWIVAQESDVPLIAEQIRTTGAGDSFLFNPHRYWRNKRRGHGYVQNSPAEVKDFFRYIDQITPWKKAQKVRNLWEVRQHHPMPKFHRPELAMHRNSPGLLPSHMWDLDKKTGRVKSLKDSVSTYQTLEPYPKWVQL